MLMTDKLLTEAVYFQMGGMSIFKTLTPDVRKYLAQHSVVKCYSKNEPIWQRLDKGDFCVLILEGMVEINSAISNGEERIIGIFGPGEIVGISALLRGRTFPANAIVSSKTARVFKLYIRGVDQDDSLDKTQQMEIQSWLREMLLAHEQILRDKIMITGAGDIHQKLVVLFDQLRLRFSYRSDDDNFLIEAPMTKTQIAKMIEARVETVIRTLNKWEKANHLKMTEHGPQLSNFTILKKLDRVK